MSKTIHKQGDYTSLEVIDFIHKYAPKGKQYNAYTFKSIGRNLIDKLKSGDLSSDEIKKYVVDTINNPPEIPAQLTQENPVKTINREEKIKIECVYTTLKKEGKEILQFTEKGLDHIYKGNHPDFEEVGKAEITGHEDDGRIFKNQTVKRISDGKLFYYNYVWHSLYDNDYWDKQLTEIV